MSLNGENLKQKTKLTIQFCEWKTINPWAVFPCPGAVFPCPGAISPFLNIFFTESAWPIKVKFHVESFGKGNKDLCNGPGHMTKMAVMLIYGRNV